MTKDPKGGTQDTATRRNFIGKSGVMAAGAIAGLAARPAQAETQCAAVMLTKWDRETDIVVVGFGGAGASAAVAGHDVGAEMLILEVAPKEFRGGNTTCSGGGFVYPYDKPKYLNYLRKLCFGATSDQLLQDWVDVNAGILDWMTKLGFRYKMDVHNYGHFFSTSGVVAGTTGGTADSGIDHYIGVDEHGIPFAGKGVFDHLAAEVEKRNIAVLYETRARELVQDAQSGEILGLKATDASGKEIAIKARRGVILACGGFENNPELQDSHINPGVRSYPAGTVYNLGDGVYMSQKAGADIFHMAGIEWVGYGIRPTKSDASLWAILTGLQSGIIVNKYGKRIYNEAKGLVHTKTFPALEFDGYADDPTSLSDYKGIPSFAIFDEARRMSGPLLPDAGMGYLRAHGLYTWSKDNLAEIESGVIKKADTIQELAGKLGIDPVALQATVAKFNGFATAGSDTDFNRGAKSMKPIARPPYYGAQLDTVYINTQGGPKHSPRDGQVLTRDNKPIPRLFAAGECGSVYSMMYHGSGNVAEAIMVGKLSGELAAKAKPWVAA